MKVPIPGSIWHGVSLTRDCLSMACKLEACLVSCHNDYKSLLAFILSNTTTLKNHISGVVLICSVSFSYDEVQKCVFFLATVCSIGFSRASAELGINCLESLRSSEKRAFNINVTPQTHLWLNATF